MRTEDDLRLLIVDDEPLAREFLRLTAEGVEGVQIVGECGDGESAVADIEAKCPDVVLLDVRMPEMTGFDVIQRVGPGRMPAVIFVTAHEEYTLRAFEVHALDYVVKPCEPARVVEALEHARDRLAGPELTRFEERLAALLSGLHGTRPGPPTPRPLRLTIRDGGRAYFVAVTDIDWIEADGSGVLLHVGDETHRIRVSLTGILDHLDPRRFTRIHRSAAVNIERVAEVQPWGGGDYVAVLSTGAELRISRTYKDNLFALVH